MLELNDVVEERKRENISRNWSELCNWYYLNTHTTELESMLKYVCNTYKDLYLLFSRRGTAFYSYVYGYYNHAEIKSKCFHFTDENRIISFTVSS